MFLAHKRFGGDITVWNPSTDAHRRIPLHGDSLMFDHLYGVGYEESRDDYLIVKIRLDGPQIQVFSLKTNVASFVHGVDVTNVDYGHNPIAGGGLLLNESLHWLVFSRATQLHVVLAFDLIHRSLFEIPLSPDLTTELTQKQYHLNVMGGYLCLCYQGRDDKCENAQIWMMKEYKVPSSWTKSFVLRFAIISYKYIQFYPICFTRCGGLFGSSGYGGLMKFNDKVHIDEWRTYFPYNDFVSPHDLYRESLLSLPSGVDEAN
ncbi:F-box protein CPR1-like [Lotus japonicus]|uniref:F-box protein CPR1-like n=1 Tax=Lotus japonicus TaxID=34305 RepID=UPI00258D88EC|nr:F-box protein CPR1-like [Lotus japonicus]